MTELKEEWDSMASMEYSKYYICRSGKIKSNRTDTILSNKPDDKGYIRPCLYNDSGKKTMPYLHVLMAKMYLPKVEGKSSVDHIDRDKLNNKIENLRWASKSEQSSNRDNYEKSSRVILKFDLKGNILCKYKNRVELKEKEGIKPREITNICKMGNIVNEAKWQFEDQTHIEGEIFHKVPDKNIEELWASNYGRIFVMRTKRAMWGVLDDNGYMRAGMKDKDGNNVRRPVHRLVLSAFRGNDSRKVNHKNSIRNDNRIDNLEYVTDSENMLHAVKQGNMGAKRVIQMDSAGNFICEYDSIMQASRAANVNNGSISMICNGKANYLAGGFKWKFKD